MNSLFKLIYHRLVHRQKKWYPLAAVFYLTYQCSFKCLYCCDGDNTPYYKLSKETADFDTLLKILKQIRKYSSYLVLTGGEPTDNPYFKEILNHLARFKFSSTVLTTNAYQLDLFLDQINESIHYLVVSLDTLNAEKADKIYQKEKGTFSRILFNIENAAKMKNRKYQIIVSSVAMPENIEDLYQCYEFAKKNKLIYAVQPQLIGVSPNEKLKNNLEYQQFFNFLIHEKKKGHKIYGSPLYLSYMRDLRYFHCNPFNMLVVSPIGEVFYPCLEIGHKISNILTYPNLHEIKRKGEELYGIKPDCGNQCQSACALGNTLMIQKPLSALYDQYLSIKGRLLGC